MTNTSIVTESARAAAAVNVKDYAASVRDHINGGWEKHHQVGVVVGAFQIPEANLASDQVTSRFPHSVNFPRMLWLQVTQFNPTTQRDEPVSVLVPVVGWEDADPGSTAVPSAPVINTAVGSGTNLNSAALAANASVTLRVVLVVPSGDAAGNPVIYQWRKNLVNIVGANSNEQVVSRAGGASAAGDYQCLVAGFGGLTYSAVATITHAP